MSSPTKLKFLCVFLISLAVFASGCSRGNREQVQKLVDEGDVLMASGNKLAQESLPKFREYMSDAKMAGFPSNREQIRGAAQETGDMLAKSAVAFREAASKYEEASKLDMKDDLRQFISLKAQALRKLAEAKEIGKEMALLPLDESINDLRTLVPKVKAADARMTAVTQEAANLQEQAKNVMKENP